MKKNVKDYVIEYISTAQPELEKMASERSSFLDALNTKLVTLVKAGSLNKTEAAHIYKKAQQNPVNVLNFLDVPTYHHRVGSIMDKEASAETKDPLYEFAFGR